MLDQFHEGHVTFMLAPRSRGDRIQEEAEGAARRPRGLSVAHTHFEDITDRFKAKDLDAETDVGENKNKSSKEETGRPGHRVN